MSKARRHSPFRHMTTRRLRLWLLGFFIALTIPTGLLIRQAYQELQWEAFHQQRLQAEALASRIDSRLLELIGKEERRSFADYAFLNVSGSSASNFLQRSPLSAFPVESDIPGMLGYFQVDTDGRFTTPLLPDDESIDRYGLTSGEYRQRFALQQQLLSVLGQNQLVKDKPKRKPFTPLAPTDRSLVDSAAEADETGTTGSLSSIAEPLIVQEALAPGPSQAAMEQESQPAMASSPRQQPAAASAPMLSQQAFDQLIAAPGRAPEMKNKASSKLGRVADLKLDKSYEDRADSVAGKQQQEFEARQKKESVYRKRMLIEPKARREVTRLPETQSLAKAQPMAPDDRDVRIRTFESEVDPFEFSLLDSGHFVLYRKVWRNGQRIIQGLLIEQQPFIEGLINSAFIGTPLAANSHLLVAWRGDVISRLAASGAREYLARSSSELAGTLLFQTALSQPTADLQLVFSIDRLPIGPGASVINWLAAILLFIMMLGFYLIYRGGARQIQLARQQQDFVSAVSHELKTPLTSIRMYGEMLQEDWASEEKKRGYYEQIVAESERLTRLINNVLQLARFSRNAIQTNLREVTIGGLLDQAKSAVSTPVSSAGFELDIECGEAIAQQHLTADPDHFMQIMINLVDNALKFAAEADNKTITLSCGRSTTGQLQISVRDYGPGIPRDQMKKIFTLFYRAENELTRETVGTGIGLALVNQLMREMDGEIDVQNSSPGAMFILSFPPDS